MKFVGQLVAGLIGLCSASAAYALPITTLEIDFDPGTPGLQTSLVVSLGSTFTVNINISNVSGLSVYDIDVEHDPGIVAAVMGGVTEGSFLGTAGSTLFFPDQPSNNRINAVGVVLFATPGASGSGTLFSVQYTALATGTSLLQFTHADLADDQFPNTQMIPVVVNGASITVPLPSTLLLLGVGLAAIAALRRRDSRSVASAGA